MTRMILGFDPSKAQGAIAELSAGLGPGVEWRVLTLDQNPNGAEPMRPAATNEHEHEEGGGLLQRLAGWLGKAGEQSQHQERKPINAATPAAPSTEGSGLELSEEELAYLRRAPTRAATVILVTSPGSQDANLRMWMVRHGGFNLAHTQVGPEHG